MNPFICPYSLIFFVPLFGAKQFCGKCYSRFLTTAEKNESVYSSYGTTSRSCLTSNVICLIQRTKY
jgi:hypothetical protein